MDELKTLVYIIISKELWTIVCGEVGCVWHSTIHLSDAHLYWDNSVQLVDMESWM